MNVKIEILGVDKFLAGMAQIERGLTSLKPLWEACAKEFYRQESAHFAAAPFAPLSPAYARRKQAQYGNKPILQATGRLLKSLTVNQPPDSVHRITDTTAEFGSNVPYLTWHQTGTTNMPARPPIAEADEARYDTLMGEYVARLVKDAGFA